MQGFGTQPILPRSNTWPYLNLHARVPCASTARGGGDGPNELCVAAHIHTCMCTASVHMHASTLGTRLLTTRLARSPPLPPHPLHLQLHSIGRLPALDTGFTKYHSHSPSRPSAPPPTKGSPSPPQAPSPKKGAAGEPSDWLVRTGLEPQVQAWMQQYEQRQRQLLRQQRVELEQQLRAQQAGGGGGPPALQLPLLAPLPGACTGGQSPADLQQLLPLVAHAAQAAELTAHQPYPRPVQELERDLQLQRHLHQLQKQRTLQQRQLQQPQLPHGPHKPHAAAPHAQGPGALPMLQLRKGGRQELRNPCATAPAHVLQLQPPHQALDPASQLGCSKHRHKQHCRHRVEAQPMMSALELHNLSLNWLRCVALRAERRGGGGLTKEERGGILECNQNGNQFCHTCTHTLEHSHTHACAQKHAPAHTYTCPESALVQGLTCRDVAVAVVPFLTCACVRSCCAGVTVCPRRS